MESCHIDEEIVSLVVKAVQDDNVKLLDWYESHGVPHDMFISGRWVPILFYIPCMFFVCQMVHPHPLWCHWIGIAI